VRISDARYSRDLRRYQLAWRLIRHEARNRTVERWTGLSMHRVRTLFRAYAAGTTEHPRSPLRGVAPHQVSFFWRSAHVKCEAAVLAGFLKAYGVCPAAPTGNSHEHLESLGRGEQLCLAYEEFKAYWPTAESTLEHAILLLTELTRGLEIALGRCLTCHILIVIDRLGVGPPRCAYCAYDLQAGLPYVPAALETSDRSRVAPDAQAAGENVQGSLF
jgi:hypothetical protein